MGRTSVPAQNRLSHPNNFWLFAEVCTGPRSVAAHARRSWAIEAKACTVEHVSLPESRAWISGASAGALPPLPQDFALSGQRHIEYALFAAPEDRAMLRSNPSAMAGRYGRGGPEQLGSPFIVLPEAEGDKSRGLGQ